MMAEWDGLSDGRYALWLTNEVGLKGPFHVCDARWIGSSAFDEGAVAEVAALHNPITERIHADLVTVGAILTLVTSALGAMYLLFEALT